MSLNGNDRWRPAMPLILEGIVTTCSAAGDLNIAPMGPIVDASMTWLRLRPYQTSTTFSNLKATRAGVFHVIDDVLLIAQAALDGFEPHGTASRPLTQPAITVSGQVLTAAARWYEFHVESIDDSTARSEIHCQIRHTGQLRELFGFHRARHAVLEATILATRCHLIPEADIRRQLAELQVIVAKTAGTQEWAAWQYVESYIDTQYRNQRALP